MLSLSLILLLVSKAVTIRRYKSVLLSRVVVTILINTCIISFHSSIYSSIYISGGLFLSLIVFTIFTVFFQHYLNRVYASLMKTEVVNMLFISLALFITFLPIRIFYYKLAYESVNSGFMHDDAYLLIMAFSLFAVSCVIFRVAFVSIKYNRVLNMWEFFFCMLFLSSTMVILVYNIQPSYYLVEIIGAFATLSISDVVEVFRKITFTMNTPDLLNSPYGSEPVIRQPQLQHQSRPHPEAPGWDSGSGYGYGSNPGIRSLELYAAMFNNRIQMSNIRLRSLYTLAVNNNGGAEAIQRVLEQADDLEYLITQLDTLNRCRCRILSSQGYNAQSIMVNTSHLNSSREHIDLVSQVRQHFGE